MQQQETIRHIPVWSGWVRLTHWLLALGIGFTWLSQQAIAWGAADADFWRDWHMIVGELLIIVITARVILAVLLPGSANWRSFIPDAAMWQGALTTLRFYLSWGRTELPHWYAHNPLWRVLYALLMVLVLACAATGLFYNSPNTWLGLPAYAWHAGLASAIGWWCVLHVIAVFAHDLKGKVNAVSGMISGFRYFHVPAKTTPEVESPFKGSTPPVYISVDSIKRKP